ncbi:MAG: hypothetical protein ACRDCE_11290 [Cetobacterium sp.]|uniref:hypothetical protein n=1 Tax=Cetobacterium sp. TaxID=2071632 RepID=UPI003EE674F2
MWVLTQDDFEGLGDYFIGCWENKPTFEEVDKAIKRPHSGIPFQEMRKEGIDEILSTGYGSSSCFRYTLEEFC